MQIILLLVLTSSLNSNASNDVQRISRSDFSVESKDKNLILRIRTVTESAHKKYLDSSKNIFFWGVTTGSSSNVIENMEATYKGEQIFVPYIAFSDLANIDSISYVSDKFYSIFKILGGDEGSGYRAYFYFDRGEMVKRKVESRTFPDNFYSVTSFTNIPIVE